MRGPQLPDLTAELVRLTIVTNPAVRMPLEGLSDPPEDLCQWGLFCNRAGLATRSVSERSAQMRSMRLIAPALAVICMFVAPSLARSQGGNPPASIKESGATSGHGMTAAEQTGKGRNAEQTIQALTEELRQAFLTGDVATFDKLLGDDFIHITAWGTSATKPEVLARFNTTASKAPPPSGPIGAEGQDREFNGEILRARSAYRQLVAGGIFA